MSTAPAHPISPTTPEETTAERVQRLLALWREQTGFLSSPTARISHPAYQELISQGPAALPGLFDDLHQTLDGHL